MKTRPIPKPTDELLAKCDAENQFENFDRLFHSVISVPRVAVLKEEVKHKRQKKRAKRKLG